MITYKTKSDLLNRSDHDIQAEIYEVIWKHEAIRSVDADSFSALVGDGIVCLMGHLSKAHNRKLIEDIVHSVPGVVAVNNKLVVDDELTLQVAQALGRDIRTRPFILPVGCSHGWVRLGGEVPTRELQLVAEEVAAGVPSVRGVVMLPNVTGEKPSVEQCAFQPQLKARVYDGNGYAGIATQVVIQPRNRLVTHVVVSTSEFTDDGIVSNEHVVPADAIEWVSQGSIFLRRNALPLNAFPVFEPADYPLAPPNWQPPYPYTAGIVRWSLEEREETLNRSGSV